MNDTPQTGTTENPQTGKRFDIGRLEYLDPRTLVIDPCNHRKTQVEPDAKLIASVEEIGVQDPITVRPLDGDQYGVLKGQRRWRAALKAAAKAEKANRPIPLIASLIRDDLAGRDADAIVRSMVENTQRKNPEKRDDLAALAQLSLLDVTPAARKKNARLLGLKPAAVAAATKAATLDEEKILKAVAAEFDIIDMADLSDVADEKDALFDLRRAKQNDVREGSGRGHWNHAMAQLRQAQAERQAREQLRADLDAANIQVIAQQWSWTNETRPLTHLRTGLDNELTATDHGRTCPGHAVYIDRDQVEAVAVCTGWKAHSHTLAAEHTHEEEPAEDREAKAAELRIVKANNKAWKASREVRWEFITELVARKTVSDAGWTLILTTITGTSHEYARYIKRHKTELVARFLKAADPNAELPMWNRVTDPFAELIARTPKTRRGNILLAHTAAAVEDSSMGDNAWRGPARDVHDWLTFLQAEGYVWSDVEKDTVAAAKATMKAAAKR